MLLVLTCMLASLEKKQLSRNLRILTLKDEEKNVLKMCYPDWFQEQYIFDTEYHSFRPE